MSIWAIADIHASRTDPTTGLPEKPMNVFGSHWAAHVDRIEQAWEASVEPDDTVIVAGDTDWALHLADAAETLDRIDSWMGTKILLRGNHDYWWSSKTTAKVRKALPPSILALHNNAFQIEGFNICGAKGSTVPGGMDWTEQDAKLFNREQERLRLSLEARDPSLPTIVALHYPPLYASHPSGGYRSLLEEAGVRCCVYGHLHGNAAAWAVRGRYGRVDYRLVAADGVGFAPVLVARDRAIVRQVKNERVDDMENGDESLKDLAEKAIDDKRQDGNAEDRARELYDVVSEDPSTLAAEQSGRRTDEAE